MRATALGSVTSPITRSFPPHFGHTPRQSRLLEALKETYPALELDAGLASIKGVVVERAGTRRRYHKRYD